MSLDRATAASLRQAGRQPPVAFRIELEDGRILDMQRLLRILPGKRLTGVGLLEGQPILAKLFIAPAGSERHWERERSGIVTLVERSIPTPQLLEACKLKAGGYCLLTEFVADGRTPSGSEPLEPVFAALGQLHVAGLVQEDAHFGNFLLTGNRALIIDGDAIRPAVTAADMTRNLALLLAQLPPAVERTRRAALLAAYHSDNPAAQIDVDRLPGEVARARRNRLAAFLKKCLRDCTQFKVTRSFGRFVAFVREEADILGPLLADPDRWMAAGTPLKQGNSATVARIQVGARQFVIKRYNIKGPGHAVSRCWRPSRAWHSWLEGNRLGFLGIATPRPLALIERRIGPLRGRAWLITEYCPGENLAVRLAPYLDASPPDAELAAVCNLFDQLTAARISHGDLKATNLLWDGHRLSLVDLDAMRQHDKVSSFARAWHKDRARFLRNWPAGSSLRATLEAALPDA